MRDLPELFAALAFFGALVVCPLIYLLLKHQRSMAEILHDRGGDDNAQRIAILEEEVRHLRLSQQQLMHSLLTAQRESLPNIDREAHRSP